MKRFSALCPSRPTAVFLTLAMLGCLTTTAQAGQIDGATVTPSAVMLGANGEAGASVEVSVSFKAQDAASCAVRLAVLSGNTLEFVTVQKTAAKVTRGVTLKGAGKHTIVLAGFPYGTVPACEGTRQIEVMAYPSALAAPAAAAASAGKVNAPANAVSPPAKSAPSSTVTLPAGALVPPPPAIKPSSEALGFTKITGIKLLGRGQIFPEHKMEILFEGSGPGYCYFRFGLEGPGNVKAAIDGYQIGAVNSSQHYGSQAIIHQKSFPVGKYRLTLVPFPPSPKSCQLDTIKPLDFEVLDAGSTVTNAQRSGNPDNVSTIIGASAPIDWLQRGNYTNHIFVDIKGRPGTKRACAFDYELTNTQDGTKVGPNPWSVDTVPQQRLRINIGKTADMAPGSSWRFVAKPRASTQAVSCYFPDGKVETEMSIPSASDPVKITGIKLAEGARITSAEGIMIFFEGTGLGKCFFEFEGSGPGNIKPRSGLFQMLYMNNKTLYTPSGIFQKDPLPVGKYRLGIKKSDSPNFKGCELGDNIKPIEFEVVSLKAPAKALR